MAKILNKGFDKTSETDFTVSAAGLDYGTNFRVKGEEPGEVVLTNLTSPRDRVETLRFGFSEVKDVYKNTSIDQSVQAASKAGVQILSGVYDTYSLTDDTDAGYRVDLPVSAHLVVKIPNSEYIAASDVLELVMRAVGGLFEGETAATTRIESMLRGSLKPSDV